jgi:signal transduction histidine kinase
MNNTAPNVLVQEENHFVYLAAHDLRAPLMSIKGLIYLMKHEPERKQLELYFELLEKSVDKVDHSISKIITYSKNGEPETIVQQVELKSILQESMDILLHMDGANAVKIQINAEEVGLFLSDQNLLFCVFSNIISNAIRYRDVSKESSHLNIHLSYTKKGAEIVFVDNGIGIEKSMQSKIFDKFFLANHNHNGTGLGLYAVRSCLQKLGGKITVDSVLGVGTKFHLFVPNLMGRSTAF